LAVPQRLAESGDVNAKRALHDHAVRPHGGHQVGFAEDISGVADERDQDVEGAATELHRHTVALQQSLRSKYPEGTERGGLTELPHLRSAVERISRAAQWRWKPTRIR